MLLLSQTIEGRCVDCQGAKGRVCQLSGLESKGVSTVRERGKA